MSINERWTPLGPGVRLDPGDPKVDWDGWVIFEVFDVVEPQRFAVRREPFDGRVRTILAARDMHGIAVLSCSEYQAELTST